MKIHAVFAQYPCAYPGQYAPTVLEAVDEFTNMDNHEPLEKAIAEAKKYEADGDIIAWAVVDIEVDGDAIAAILNPSGEVAGTITSSTLGTPDL